MPNGVIVGFDGSDRARDAVWWAADEARRRDSPLTLVQAHGIPVSAAAYAWGPVGAGGAAAAFPGVEPAVVLGDDRVREHTEQELATLAKECRAQTPDLVVATEVGEGRASAVLLAAADSHDAALVVVGATGLGALPRAVLGSTAAELVHDAARPVVVVRGDRTRESARAPVVLGTGGTDAADHAVGFAFEFSARRGCPLHVVHAWSDSPLDVLATLGLWEPGTNTDEVADHIDEYVLGAERRRHPSVDVDVRVVHDRPARALVEQAAAAGLLVVGSRGRGAVRRALLGSVSHAAIYHAPCPVAVVP
jgi:nucleotide-binding universal stress UspA family protein